MLNRKLAPPFKRSIAFDLLQPEKINLTNGAAAYFVSGGSQNVIRVELIFSAGKWVEQHDGASYFTSQLLSKGTATKTSFEIAQLFDQYGAHLEISPGFDVVTVSIFTLNKNLESVLALLFELLTFSLFPEKELDQIKSTHLQNLKVNQEKTSFLASKLIRKNLFGEVHPYGKEIEEKETNTILREQIVQHYHQFFTDVTIIASGKITEQNKRCIVQTLSALPFVSVPQKIISLLDRKRTTQHVEKESSVQSSIRMGKRIINRTHPDYADVVLLNHILGGYFGSRLMKNIREEKGLTYGISSSLHILKHDGFLVIGADVNKENLGLTMDEIRKELHRLGTEKIDDEELDIARNHFIGSLQLEITTPFAHADKAKNMLLFNLPGSYYTQLISRMDTVTADELLGIGGKYFSEDSFTEVAVG